MPEPTDNNDLNTGNNQNANQSNVQNTSDNLQVVTNTGGDQMIAMESYKTLQRLIVKRDQRIVELETQNTALHEQIEILKLGGKSLTDNTTALQTKLDELSTALSTKETELNEALAKTERQTYLMENHPEIIEFSKFITGKDMEDYKVNAKAFSEQIKAKNVQATNNKLSGSSIPVTDPETTSQQDEVDQLWETIQLLAGSTKPEDIAKFNAANDRWVELMSKQD